MAVETGDKKDVPLETGAEESSEDGTRRRRRRGMRVPSDDVPRPTPAVPIAVVPQPVHVDSEVEFDVDVEPPAEDDLEPLAPPPNVGDARAAGATAELPPPEAATASSPVPEGILLAAAVTPLVEPSAAVTASTSPGVEEGVEIDVDVAAEAAPPEERLAEVVPIPSTALTPTAESTEIVDASVREPAPEPEAKPVVEPATETATEPEPAAAATAPEPAPAPVSEAEATDEELELSPLELVEDHATAPTPPVPPPPPAATVAPPPPPRPPPMRELADAAVAVLEQQRPKRRRSRAWWEEIFDEDYLRTLPFLTPQATQREAAFIIEALGLKAGQQVLDVGCGYGRHAMELAARGMSVLALDLSLPLLLRGADEAQRRGLSINFVHGDMREITYESQFDGAYCVFSTFGFFDDDANKRVAMHIARALKPGGRLILEILNRDYIIADLPTRVWWEGDGCVVLEEVDFNYFTSRLMSTRQIVFEDGRQVEQEISIRAYSLHEVGKLLHGAGFRVLQVSGGSAARGRFFGKDSRQIIVVAEKRPDASRDSTPNPDASTPNGRL
jgi:SAM-dependent methyltransferase